MAKGPRIKSRADALEWLLQSRAFHSGATDERTAGNNTTVRVREDQSVAVRLHASDVVVYHVDGSTSLYTGGWRTSTTKERINHYCPPGWSVSSIRGVWWLRRGDVQWFPFAEGITIHADGSVSGAGLDETVKIRTVSRSIAAYAEKYVDNLFSGNVPPPGEGDCWYCLFRVGEGTIETGTLLPDGTVCNAAQVGPALHGVTMGEHLGNHDHLRTHMEEGYYVPSLLVRAIEVFPVSRAAAGELHRQWFGNDREPLNVHRVLAQLEFTKSLTRYLKRVLLEVQA